MEENENSENTSSLAKAYLQFIAPLPRKDGKPVDTTAISTGTAVIKKTMSPDHGNPSLNDIQKQNVAASNNATPLPKTVKSK